MNYDYVMTARKLSGGEFGSEPGPVRYLKVASNKTNYGANDVVGSPGTWMREVQGLADGDENPASISPSGDVLIFVHGYNNTIEAVLSRMRRLRAHLKQEGWRGEIVSFDWPSANQVLNYLEDRADGAEVALSLVTKGIKLLAEGQKAGCQTNIHVLAHSAGAYVTMEAFVQAEKSGELYKKDWRIGQVAFIGADVSARSLNEASDWSNPMFKRIMRLTNYSSPFDAALAVSNAKRLGAAPRAGRGGLPNDVSPKAVNVNCSEYFTGIKPPAQSDGSSWTHSWHFSDRVFARDLAMTLEGAIDRHALPTRKLVNGELFLQDKPRPAFQQEWNIRETAQYADRRTV